MLLLYEPQAGTVRLILSTRQATRQIMICFLLLLPMAKNILYRTPCFVKAKVV